MFGSFEIILVKIQHFYPWQIIKISVHVLQDNIYFPILTGKTILEGNRLK